MIHKDCVNYDGDSDCHKCCSPNHDKYILSCPADCSDYRDAFTESLKINEEQN